MMQHPEQQELSAFVDMMGTEDERQRIERHLASCAACRDEVEEILSMRQDLQGLSRSAKPAQDLWPGIRQHLEPDRAVTESGETRAGQRTVRLSRSSHSHRLAWAAVVLLMVVSAGALVWKVPWLSDEDPTLASSQRVQQLLQAPTVWDRLEGIRLAAQLEQVDPKTISALLDVLRHDDNNNARLAVVTTLRDRADDPEVQRGVGRAILEQQSPIVQMEILSQIVATRPPGGSEMLREKLADESLQPEVRQAIETALVELKP